MGHSLKTRDSSKLFLYVDSVLYLVVVYVKIVGHRSCTRHYSTVQPLDVSCVWRQDCNAGWSCATLGALAPVVLFSVQASTGDRSAQPYIDGEVLLARGQQQRYCAQSLLVGGELTSVHTVVHFTKQETMDTACRCIQLA